LKTTPWAQVLVYPLEATPTVVRRGYAKTDVLAHLRRDPAAEPPDATLGDRWVGGVHLTTPTLALATGTIRTDRKLLWWDLNDSVESSKIGGYTVMPYLVPRNNAVFDPTRVTIHGREDYRELLWIPRTGRWWADCMPDGEPATGAIDWRGTDRDEPFCIETMKDLPEGQNWAMRLWWLGEGPHYGEDDLYAPFAEITWGGNTWAVQFSSLKPPQLVRWVNGEWRACRQFGEFSLDPFLAGDPMWLKVFHIAGRMVVRLEPSGGAEAAQVVFTEMQEDAWGARVTKSVVSPRGPVSLSGRAVAMTAQLHEYKWGTWEPETTNEWGMVTPARLNNSGSFSREYSCNGIVNSTAQKAAAFGWWGDGSPTRRPGFSNGDAGSVGTVTDEPLRDSRGRTTGRRRYTCEIGANNPHGPAVDEEEFTETCMVGASSPFVYAVSIRLGHSTVSRSLAPIDIRPALVSMSEDLADPALQAGPAWRMNINRNLLGESLHGETGLPIGASWTNYLKRYHRLVVNVSWMHSNGLRSAAPWDPEGDAVDHYCRLDGFVSALGPATEAYGRWGGTIEARDACLLLQRPAGVIDGRFAPLDLLMMEKLDEGAHKLMGWEGVSYILETALGPDWAEELQTWFAASHYDLLTHKMLLDPPHGGFFFPPPFGQDAYSWIQTLAERDFALFFFGPSLTDPTKLVANYGNYFEYLAGAPTRELPDAVYQSGDEDDLIFSAGSQQMSRQDYNRVLVYGAPPGQGDLGGIMPALESFSAEARIETGSPIDEQNIADTWERTLVLSGTHFWLPLVARIVAQNTARLIRGVDMRGITLKVRGQPGVWWGWRVRPKMDGVASDPHGLNLDGQLSRIMRVRNDWDFERGTWETTLRVAPEPEV
jgi:hypothetical protein